MDLGGSWHGLTLTRSRLTRSHLGFWAGIALFPKSTDMVSSNPDIVSPAIPNWFGRVFLPDTVPPDMVPPDTVSPAHMTWNRTFHFFSLTQSHMRIWTRIEGWWCPETISPDAVSSDTVSYAYMGWNRTFHPNPWHSLEYLVRGCSDMVSINLATFLQNLQYHILTSAIRLSTCVLSCRDEFYSVVKIVHFDLFWRINGKMPSKHPVLGVFRFHRQESYWTKLRVDFMISRVQHVFSVPMGRNGSERCMSEISAKVVSSRYIMVISDIGSISRLTTSFVAKKC